MMFTTKENMDKIVSRLIEAKTNIEKAISEESELIKKEEGEDSPNEEKIDILDSQIQCLESTTDLFEQLIEILQDY